MRPATSASGMRVSRGWLRPAVLVLALLGVGGYGLREYEHARATPDPALRAGGEEAPLTGPVTTTIAPPIEVPIADSASLSIPAGGHVSYTFSGGGRSGCRVHGEVKALSGGDRRIGVSVVDRDGLAELDAGRTPHTYYDSGPTADVALDVNLDGRSQYTLVVSNTGGGKRAKSVRIRSVTASCAD